MIYILEIESRHGISLFLFKNFKIDGKIFQLSRRDLHEIRMISCKVFPTGCRPSIDNDKTILFLTYENVGLISY